MVEALELAVVLVQFVVTGGEAAGRKSERNLAEGKNFRLDAGRATGRITSYNVCYTKLVRNHRCFFLALM